MTQVTANLVMVLLGGAVVLTAYRLFRGPTFMDRVVALDLLGTIVAGFIAVYAIATDQSVYIRDAIVLAVVSFLGTVAFSYYAERGGKP